MRIQAFVQARLVFVQIENIEQNREIWRVDMNLSKPKKTRRTKKVKKKSMIMKKEPRSK